MRVPVPFFAYLYFAYLYLWGHRPCGRQCKPQERQGNRGFFRDAFGSASRRPDEATAALRYVRTVFGVPEASRRARLVYLVLCVIIYGAITGFVASEAILAGIAGHSVGGESAAAPWATLTARRLPAGLYLVGVLAWAGVVGLAGHWRRGFGSTQQRHELAIRSMTAEALARAKHGRSATPETLTPWWWLYATTTVIAAENWPKFLLRAAKFVVGGAVLLTPFLWWLHIPGTWSLAFDWLLVLLWLAVGWLLPLDGLVKLAPWEGPGNFAVAVLRANMPD